VLLSRVITRLGALTDITPQIVEGLYAADLAYLEDLYLRLNAYEGVVVQTQCPHCNAMLQLQVAPPEESD
ncbi:MAG: phage tail assembly protein, partial [Anaerolineae bacterium]